MQPATLGRVTRTLYLAALLLLPALTAHAQPEMRGPATVVEWDAGNVDAAGASIPVQVYFPEGASSAPTVIVMHGNFRNGSFHAEMARTFASRGFVTLVPDMPCGAGGCDHDANAMQLAALFDWAIAESADAASMMAGMVDAARLGLVGHSWGGLASHLATAMDARVRAVVLLDPNDDGTEGLDVASSITVPSLQLLAEVSGACNSAWEPAATHAAASAPKMQVTVAGSGHCDPEDPGDSLCGFACGSGDPSTSTIFRRYTIAWMGCFLAADAAMAPYVGGAMYTADVAGGVLTGASTEGLDGSPCAGGMTSADAGPGADAGGPARDAGAIGTDAGSVRDAGTGAARDGGGTASSGEDDGGCGCVIPGRTRGSPVPWPLLLAVLVLCYLRRR